MTDVQYQKGDIFESTAQVIVNTVNCKGVMGKGLALAFKQRYPDMFLVYQEECKTGKLRIGRPTLYKKSTPWILNFPTKDNWKANSKIEYLEQGLQYFVANYKKAGIKSIAFPKLGTQNGKLSWDEVGPLMVEYLGKVDIAVYIYIVEGDREYYPQSDKLLEIAAWEQFSETALSVNALQKEADLSLREAKKIYERRQAVEFTSQADIDAISDLAKISSKRVKEYIHRQQFVAPELPGMKSEEQSKQKKKKATSPRQGRKSASKKTERSEPSLFSAIS